MVFDLNAEGAKLNEEMVKTSRFRLRHEELIQVRANHAQAICACDLGEHCYEINVSLGVNDDPPQSFEHTLAGIPLEVSREFPVDEIAFVNRSGEIVGRIYNLMVPR